MSNLRYFYNFHNHLSKKKMLFLKYTSLPLKKITAELQVLGDERNVLLRGRGARFELIDGSFRESQGWRVALLAGAHGHPHVEQRGLAPGSPHVARPTAHPHDAQGLRVPAAAARPLLPLPAGTLPQRNAAKGEILEAFFQVAMDDILGSRCFLNQLKFNVGMT
jgi:hypothetical protein